jgi:ABC-type Fe3+ transport system substrate-binding protein
MSNTTHKPSYPRQLAGEVLSALGGVKKHFHEMVALEALTTMAENLAKVAADTRANLARIANGEAAAEPIGDSIAAITAALKAAGIEET